MVATSASRPSSTQPVIFKIRMALFRMAQIELEVQLLFREGERTYKSFSRVSTYVKD